jgi:hypothetical protein
MTPVYHASMPHRPHAAGAVSKALLSRCRAARSAREVRSAARPAAMAAREKSFARHGAGRALEDPVALSR